MSDRACCFEIQNHGWIDAFTRWPSYRSCAELLDFDGTPGSGHIDSVDWDTVPLSEVTERLAVIGYTEMTPVTDLSKILDFLLEETVEDLGAFTMVMAERDDDDSVEDYVLFVFQRAADAVTFRMHLGGA